MEEEIIFKILANVGVPAAICFYTLYGVNKTLEELTTAIKKLGADVDKHQSRQVQEFNKLKDEVKELRFEVNLIQNKYLEVRNNERC